jgi:hypothetical protein
VSGTKATNIAATTAAVTNRLVTTTNMKVGAYTVANSGKAVWQGGFLATVTGTQVGGVDDTLGTVVFVGLDLFGLPATDTIIPVNGSTVTGTTIFKSVTSVTGVGWVINTGNDTLVVGVAAGSYVAAGGGLLYQVVVNTTAAAAITVSDAGGTIATLKSSIAEGSYEYEVPWSGYLKVATTSTNDVTLVHSPGVPSSYAMS